MKDRYAMYPPGYRPNISRIDGIEYDMSDPDQKEKCLAIVRARNEAKKGAAKYPCFHDKDRECCKPFLRGCGGIPPDGYARKEEYPYWVVLALIVYPDPVIIGTPTQQLSFFEEPKVIKKWRSSPSAYDLEKGEYKEHLYDKRQWWVMTFFCEWGAKHQAWREKYLLGATIIEVVKVERPKKRGKEKHSLVSGAGCWE